MSLHAKGYLQNLKYVGVSLLLLSSLCFSVTSIADESISTIDKQISQELTDLGDIYQVTSKTKELAQKAAITFHGNLLETSENKKQHTMTLSASEVKALKGFGFTVVPDTNWAAQYKATRTTQIQSQQLLSLSTSDDIQPLAIPGYSCYPTVEETFQTAQALANNNPTLASWIDIGDSWEKTVGQGGYDLMVLKITNQNNTGSKPKLFIHSAMHAREYTPAALTLDFAEQLINSYGSDADSTWIIDHHEVHILFQTKTFPF